MRPLRLLIELLLTRPRLGLRTIAELAEVGYTTACRYRRLLRQQGGDVDGWLSLSDAELHTRFNERHRKPAPSPALASRWLTEGASVIELWEDYRAANGPRALAYAQFAKAIRPLCEAALSREAAERGLDALSPNALATELAEQQNQLRRRRRLRARRHRISGQPRRHSTRCRTGRYARSTPLRAAVGTRRVGQPLTLVRVPGDTGERP